MRLGCVVAVACLSTGCQNLAPQQREAGREPLQGPYRAGQGRWGERYLVDAQALPAVWLQPGRGEGLFVAGDKEQAEGAGWAVRGAVGNRDQSIGTMVLGAHLEGERSQERLDVYAVFADFGAEVPLADGPTGFAVRVGCGFGLAHWDYAQATPGDRTTGALNLRGGLQFAATPWLGFEVGGGGLVFGHPGDTLGYGTFFEVGVRVTF